MTGNEPTDCLYQRALGPAWARLPAPLRQLHEVRGRHAWQGMASVENGRSLLARLCRVLMGFPAAAAEVPVRVTLERIGESERWTREFGASRFHSVLSLPRDGEAGVVIERFGLLSFRLGLPADEHGLEMPMRGARVLGLPLPRLLTPRSRTREFVDDQGRFCFDVAVSLPAAGLLVHYRGWLLPS
ncbi:MAG TPA: DUF4166 domain-containing protein [Nevskiaceae bacterium]|nr:DUF4166 domain-containing protein [Nevskiaceae bacterium]